MKHEENHRVAMARELTAAAGVPLRGRYGFAASDEDVLAVVNAVSAHPRDEDAAEAIGIANALGDIQLAGDDYLPIDEVAEMQIVRSLRPLVEQRRDAAVRGLR